MTGTDSGGLLDELYGVIESRKGASPDKSHTAALLAGGRETCARKVGEEAVEMVVAALGDDREALISESADLLYHLLVLLASADVRPAEVYAELARRAGRSGIEEKRARQAAPAGN